MSKGDEILKGELVGINSEIVDAKNKACIGIKGKIINETKNTFTIQTEDNKRKMMHKDQVVLMIEKDNKKFLVNGNLLKSRPEDRIKVRGKW